MKLKRAEAVFLALVKSRVVNDTAVLGSHKQHSAVEWEEDDCFWHGFFCMGNSATWFNMFPNCGQAGQRTRGRRDESVG